MLKDSINTTYYFWDGLDSTNSFSITFKVLVVDEEGRERSDTRTTNILTERDLRRFKRSLLIILQFCMLQHSSCNYQLTVFLLMWLFIGNSITANIYMYLMVII